MEAETLKKPASIGHVNKLEWPGNKIKPSQGIRLLHNTLRTGKSSICTQYELSHHT